MATVTGLTKERMLEIEGASVVDGEIVGGNLILTKHDGTTIDAGPVVGPQGPPGPVGPSGFSAIPGEVRMWSGSSLPNPASYGKWVWADGAVYASATYPEASTNIGSQWRTFAGASDPGAGNFRVPDLRGLVAAGLDAMPGGSRANRMTRSVAITLAGRTGEEVHVITIGEMSPHSHGVNDGWHSHALDGSGDILAGNVIGGDFSVVTEGGSNSRHSMVASSPSNISIQNTGSGNAHENVQPTVFVPYIVKLDG